jgi:uncharacterized protein YjbI with pentapeptide repeats
MQKTFAHPRTWPCFQSHGTTLRGRSARLSLLLRSVMAASLLSACTGSIADAPDNPIVPRAPVARVDLLPGTVPLLAPGGSAQLTAQVRDAGGQSLPDRSVTWASSSAGVASVSAAGLVTAAAAGAATITATSEGVVSAGVTITVRESVARVIVTPAEVSLVPGAVQALVTSVQSASGTVLADRPITWTSANPAIATVSTSGVLTATGVGETVLTAASEGVAGRVAVTVQQPVATVSVSPGELLVERGQSARLIVSVRDIHGSELSGVAVTWMSSAPATASVDRSGWVTGVGVGQVSIVASAAGRTGSSTIRVVSPPASVRIMSRNPFVYPGTSVQLSATLLDEAGSTLVGRAVTWSVSNPDIATVSSSGILTGLAAGRVTVAVSAGGVTDTTSGTVWAQNFSGRDLSGRDFNYQTLPWVDFSGASLINARFVNARVTNSTFRNSDLSGANLEGASFLGTDFTGVNLTNAKFGRTTVWPSGFLPSGRGMWGPGLDYSGQDLSSRDFAWQDFRGSRFVGTNLRSVQLRGIRAEDADFTNADLRGARLHGADLTDATLTGVQLANVTFDRETRWPAGFSTSGRGMWGPGLDYSGQDLSSRDFAWQDFRGSRFVGTNLQGVQLRDIRAEGADFTNADLRRARLHGADLTDATLAGALLVGAWYNRNTIWPSGFDPVLSGAILEP